MKKKPYWKMSAEELARATREFDKPIPRHRLKPLTPEQRRRWEESKGQPSLDVFVSDEENGRSSAVFVRLDPDLLRRSYECARAHDMTWDQLMERGLLTVLTALEAPAKKPRRSA